MSELIQALYEEHENISRFLDKVQQLCLDLMERDVFDPAAFREAIRFIREYADKEHHQKEERLLFQAMTDELGGVAVNLIQHGMLVEHDQARLFVADLEQAVNGYEADRSPAHKLAILANAASYRALLRRHIEKENNAIYPFAQRSLKPETLAALDQSFRKEQLAKQG